jgi:hypothetical protein
MRTGASFLRLIAASALLTVLLIMAMLNVASAQGGGESKKEIELYPEIRRMDSILFSAFNKRDTGLFKKFFTKDLEFYHDKSGLTGFDQTVKFMRSTTLSGNDLKRELLKESLEIYPIPGYGAIQTGKHRFCHTENNKQDCGMFKFVHIWQLKDGEWKISRIISYDH